MTADAPPARVLAFEAAGVALALPASAVERVLEPPPVQRVPGTPRWFAGVAVTGGRLLPLTDLGAWLGAQGGPGGPGGASVECLLELDASLGPAGLLVGRVEGLVDCRAARADELADDPSRRLGPRRPRTRAVVADGIVRALIDPVALLESPAFVDLTVSA